MVKFVFEVTKFDGEIEIVEFRAKDKLEAYARLNTLFPEHTKISMIEP